MGVVETEITNIRLKGCEFEFQITLTMFKVGFLFCFVFWFVNAHG